MILVIGAMKEEITFLVSQLEEKNTLLQGGFTFYTGKLHQKELVIVESGIGKVMSGILVATAHQIFPKVKQVINIGVAGGTKDLHIGDIVIGDNCFYGDADVTVFSYQYGQIPRFPFLFAGDRVLKEKAATLGGKLGDICTMDRFVHDETFVNELIKKHFSNQNIQCFDMESAAFAQSCHFYGLPFLSIRAISDVIGNEEQRKLYEDSLDVACKKSNDFLMQLLEIL